MRRLTSTGNDRLLDVVYEPSSGLWACCTNATSPVQCQNPFDETFDAPAPTSLSTLFSIPPTGFSPTSQVALATGTTTTSVTYTTPAPSATTSVSSQKSGLSGGADAGIGIGVTLVAVLAIAGVLFMWFRRRKAARLTGERPAVVEADYEGGWKPAAQNPMVEAPAYSPRLPAELPN